MSRYENEKFLVGIEEDSVVIRIVSHEGAQLCRIELAEPDVDTFIRKVVLMREILKAIKETSDEDRR